MYYNHSYSYYLYIASVVNKFFCEEVNFKNGWKYLHLSDLGPSTLYKIQEDLKCLIMHVCWEKRKSNDIIHVYVLKVLSQENCFKTIAKVLLWQEITEWRISFFQI